MNLFTVYSLALQLDSDLKIKIYAFPKFNKSLESCLGFKLPESLIQRTEIFYQISRNFNR